MAAGIPGSALTVAGIRRGAAHRAPDPDGSSTENPENVPVAANGSAPDDVSINRAAAIGCDRRFFCCCRALTAAPCDGCGDPAAL